MAIKVNGEEIQLASKFSELKPHQASKWISEVMFPLPDALGTNADGETVVKDHALLEDINLNAIELLIDDEDMCALLSIPQLLMEEDIPVVVDEQPVVYSNIIFMIEEKLALFLFQAPDCLSPFDAGFKSWAAPGERFNTLRLEEYFYCEELYRAFLENKNWNTLADLAAVLYRPMKKKLDITSPEYDGDRREPFNRYTFKARAELIDTERDYDFLSCVFLWYYACRIDLLNRYPRLFERATKSSTRLKPQEELVEMAGGAFSFDINKHQRIVLVFADLHAKLIRSKS